MIGKTLSHYRILDRLGEGGMGVVYRAEDTRLGRIVALKVLGPGTVGDRDAERRFLHEAQAASALDHPNICTIYEIDEAEGQRFMAMALVEGQTLRERIQAGPLPIPEALDITAQIADGLTAAHAQGIVHRDIKSTNVILTPEGRVRILDFGLAKLEDRTELTATGAVLGTVAYMSPEQARGEKVDGRTDLWALGVILHEMITGRRPFQGASGQAVLYGIQFADPEPLTSLRSGVPLAVEQMVSKALAKDPAARYQHAGDLLADIRRHQQDRHDSTRLSTPPPLPARRRRRRSLLIPGLGLPLVALAVVALVLLTPSPSIPFAKRDWILIADFANETGEALFQGTIREALSIDLQQSQHVNVFAGRRLNEALRRSGREDLSVIDADLAREIAIREGVAAILVGSIGAIGDRYLLSARLVNPVTGDAIDTRRVQADGHDEILAAIDELSRDIRRNLGESLLSIEQRDEALAKVSTASLPALRQYTLGVERTREANWSEAIALFQGAVQEDSTFAAAYHSLAVLHQNLGLTAEALEYSALARRHGEGATDREQYLIEAEYYRIRDDYTRAIEQYELLIQLYPDEFVAHNNLCFTYQFTRQYEEALAEAKEIARLAPGSWYVHHNAALAHAGLGDYPAAIAEFELGLEANEHAYWSRVGLSWVHVLQGEVAQAWQDLDGPIASGPAWSSLRENFRAHLWRYLGDDARAVRHLEEAIATDESSRNDRAASGKLVVLAELQHRLGEPAAALASLQRAVALHADSYALAALGLQQARCGEDPAELLQRLATLAGEEPTRIHQAHRQWLQGRLRLLDGQDELGARDLAISLDFADNLDTRVELAAAYYRQGAFERARDQLEYVVDHAWAAFFDGRPESWVLALYRLGAVEMALGDLPSAMEHLRRFVELWADNPTRQDDVAAARRWLAAGAG